MPEFRVKCSYLGKRKGKFFRDKEPQDYHQFSVDNPKDLPAEHFFNFPEKDNWDNFWYYWLWISENLVKKSSIIFEKDKEYQFVMALGETKTANFKTKNFYDISAKNDNNMVLKAKEYWKNTVKKIGFWDSENHFYEPAKDKNRPPKILNQPENKSIWIKIFLISFLILFLILFPFLLIKWSNKWRKKPKRKI